MTRGASKASWILLAAAVLSAGCAKPLRPQSTAIEQLERLAVRFADDREFTVVDERANAIRPIAAGAAFPLLALVGERKAGKPTVEVVADAPDDVRTAGFDAVLEFSIDDCGFRMTNGVTEEIAAFIALTVLRDAGRRMANNLLYP
jgi:hypothetical protein